MRLSRFLLAVFLAILASLAFPSPCGAAKDPVGDYVRSEMRRRRIPAVSIAIVRDGRLVRASAFGTANLENNVPATPDTVFQIQSMTKSFTAAAILMLMEEGRLALDDPVGKYLDGTPEAWKAITIRRLLTHTSGLKDYINDATQSLRLDVTDEEVLAATAARPLNFAPGDRYAYSNTNYLLLGMIIHKLTGLRYGEFLAERIFRPLGMEHTRIYSWADIIPNRAAGYVLGPDGWRNGEYYAPSVLGYPGGGILSTARDLAKWDIALSQGRILRPETRKMMWTPACLNDGTSSQYGFGWAMGSLNGHPFQTHDGEHSSGFSSSIVRFPNDRLSVIVLANRSGANPYRIAEDIAGLYVPALATKEAQP